MRMYADWIDQQENNNNNNKLLPPQRNCWRLEGKSRCRFDPGGWGLLFHGCRLACTCLVSCSSSSLGLKMSPEPSLRLLWSPFVLSIGLFSAPLKEVYRLLWEVSPACLGGNEPPHCFRIIKSRLGLLFSLGLIDLEGTCTWGGQRPTMGIVSLLLPCESHSNYVAGSKRDFLTAEMEKLSLHVFSHLYTATGESVILKMFEVFWGGRGSSIFIPPNPTWAYLPQFLHSQNFSTVARSSPLLVLRVSFNGSLNSTQALPLMVLLFSQLWVFKKKIA